MDIYLDNHATTRVDPVVLEKMLPYFSDQFANAASRTHYLGANAARVVNESREKIAALINARAPEEIVFLSGATEANNLAVIGTARRYHEMTGKNEIIISEIEHPSVLDPANYLSTQGFNVKYARVKQNGLLDMDHFKSLISKRTILFSCMMVNNEIGVLQDIDHISQVCSENNIILHTDCAQAFGKVPIDVRKQGIDIMTATAHKIYGPKGIGFMYVKSFKPRVKVQPIIYGGGHENGLRSGTLNVPGIVGLAAAAELACRNMENESSKIRRLRDLLLNGIRERLDHIYVNGDMSRRVAGNLNISFEFIEGEALLTYLNEKGICVTSGAACSSMKKDPSHVLKALGVPEHLIHSSIRFGIGRFNTEKEIRYTVDTVIEAVNKLRELSPLYDDFNSGTGH